MVQSVATAFYYLINTSSIHHITFQLSIIWLIFLNFTNVIIINIGLIKTNDVFLLKPYLLPYNIFVLYLIFHCLYIFGSLGSILIPSGRPIFDIKNSDLLFKTYMIKPNSWIHFLFLKKNRYKKLTNTALPVWYNVRVCNEQDRSRASGICVMLA